MTYLLLMVLVMNGRVDLQPQLFADKASCEAAGEAARSLISKSRSQSYSIPMQGGDPRALDGGHFGSLDYRCVPTASSP